MAKKKVRTPIPAENERLVKVQAGYRCSVWGCGGTSGLTFHHIDGNPSNHDPANLLLLCAVCHARATSGEIDRKACRMIKRDLETRHASPSELRQVKDEIISEMRRLVGSQDVARPLLDEEKETRPPNPGVAAAARQVITFRKAHLPPPIGVLRALAHSLYKSGELDRAFTIQQLVAHSTSALAGDHYNLGVLCALAGRNAEAEKAYRKAVEVDPKDALAWSNLGSVLGAAGRKAEAEDAWRRAVEADPKHAVAWTNLGNLFSEMGRSEEAEKAHRKAVRLDPKLAPAWYNFGNFLARAGRKDEAEEAYRKAVQGSPEFALAWSALAVLLYETGRKAEAEDAYLKAVQANPKDALAWRNLGALLDETGRKAEAEAAWRKAVEADPKYAVAWRDLSILLDETGRKNDAEEAYRNAVEADPLSAQLRNSLAYCLWEMRRLDEAETEVREAIRLDPDDPYANATLGLLLFEKDDLEGGRKRYERAIELAPDDMPLLQKFHYEYGRALARNGHAEEARTQLNAGLDVDADFVSRDQIEAELAKLQD